MPKKEDESETDFNMKTDYWEIIIEKANNDEIKFAIVFKDKKIPLGEMAKLEGAIRMILEACGRLEKLQPSKR